jgi:hypothetical protein
VLDPRRVGGTSSGLNQNDVADVLAILHPVSAMAIKIVEKTASINSQHVLFRNPFGTFGSGFADIDLNEQETIILNQSDPFNATAQAGDEIALGMSAAPASPPFSGLRFQTNFLITISMALAHGGYILKLSPSLWLMPRQSLATMSSTPFSLLQTSSLLQRSDSM